MRRGPPPADHKEQSCDDEDNYDDCDFVVALALERAEAQVVGRANDDDGDDDEVEFVVTLAWQRAVQNDFTASHWRKLNKTILTTKRIPNQLPRQPLLFYSTKGIR